MPPPGTTRGQNHIQCGHRLCRKLRIIGSLLNPDPFRSQRQTDQAPAVENQVAELAPAAINREFETEFPVNDGAPARIASQPEFAQLHRVVQQLDVALAAVPLCRGTREILAAHGLDQVPGRGGQDQQTKQFSYGIHDTENFRKPDCLSTVNPTAPQRNLAAQHCCRKTP